MLSVLGLALSLLSLDHHLTLLRMASTMNKPSMPGHASGKDEEAQSYEPSPLNHSDSQEKPGVVDELNPSRPVGSEISDEAILPRFHQRGDEFFTQNEIDLIDRQHEDKKQLPGWRGMYYRTKWPVIHVRSHLQTLLSDPDSHEIFRPSWLL